jgi:hypothetical protein
MLSKQSITLIKVFLLVEGQQYPSHFKERLLEREKKIWRVIEDYGVNHVTLHTYTNMMQDLCTLTVDTFVSGRFMEGNLDIQIGSEPQELCCIRKGKWYDFDSESWKEPVEYRIEDEEDEEEYEEEDEDV